MAGCELADIMSALRDLIDYDERRGEYQRRSGPINRARFEPSDERYVYPSGAVKVVGRLVDPESQSPLPWHRPRAGEPPPGGTGSGHAKGPFRGGRGPFGRGTGLRGGATLAASRDVRRAVGVNS
jgi:hypothetical protein